MCAHYRPEKFIGTSAEERFIIAAARDLPDVSYGSDSIPCYIPIIFRKQSHHQIVDETITGPMIYRRESTLREARCRVYRIEATVAFSIIKRENKILNKYASFYEIKYYIEISCKKRELNIYFTG